MDRIYQWKHLSQGFLNREIFFFHYEFSFFSCYNSWKFSKKVTSGQRLEERKGLAANLGAKPFLRVAEQSWRGSSRAVMRSNFPPSRLSCLLQQGRLGGRLHWEAPEMTQVKGGALHGRWDMREMVEDEAPTFGLGPYIKSCAFLGRCCPFSKLPAVWI